MRLPIPWRLVFALSIPFWLLLIGAVCYHRIEGDPWDWTDAFYMSAITLTTVGYTEVHPLSDEGRWFTIVFLFLGVFTLFYTTTEIIRAVFTGEIARILGRERMERSLSHLEKHVTVCGLGGFGRFVSHDLERQEVPFVIIDQNAQVIEAASFTHGIPLHGDATSDEVLLHAGIARARALIVGLPSDADNLYIVLSARVLNDKVSIVARAQEEASIAKLRRVGANHVVSLYAAGGHRATQAVLKPTVGSFLEMASRHDADYHVEEVLVEAGSILCGQALKATRLHEDHGVVVLTIKCINGDMIMNPQGDTILEAGHVLIAVGHRGHLSKVKKLARAQETT